MTEKTRHYFVCGIGGSGMAPIASLLNGRGHKVSGSDRSYDRGQTPEKFSALKDNGFALYPQDGTGITDNIDFVVASAAIEEKIPDVSIAKEKNIPVLGKAQILSEFLNNGESIAIAGTSGKTTVTGMAGFILHECGLDPAMMCGGHIVNLLDEGKVAANAYTGQGVFVAETDESDGSVEAYSPYITVLNNITLDHKPMPELRRLFREMLERTLHKVIVNIDDPEASAMAEDFEGALTLSVQEKTADFYADGIERAADHIGFTAHDAASGQSAFIRLQMPGLHNVANAVAAIAASVTAGAEFKAVCKALNRFKGMKRRFEVVGVENNITVIDDFGHNPDKITATLRTLKDFDGRVLMMFQPHGFGPTQMMREDLVETFVKFMDGDDVLVMPEIYYAGGTAEKTISSRDIIEAVAAQGKNAEFFDSRDLIRSYFKSESQPFDRIVIMGARDDTLPAFARDILESIKVAVS